MASRCLFVPLLYFFMLFCCFWSHSHVLPSDQFAVPPPQGHHELDAFIWRHGVPRECNVPFYGTTPFCNKPLWDADLWILGSFNRKTFDPCLTLQWINSLTWLGPGEVSKGCPQGFMPPFALRDWDDQLESAAFDLISDLEPMLQSPVQRVAPAC